MTVRHDYGHEEFRASYTGAQTNTLLIQTQENRQIVIDSITLGTDTAGYGELTDGTNPKGPRIYTQVNDSEQKGNEHYIIFENGKNVCFTSNIAGNHTLYMIYHWETVSKP